MSKIEHSIDVNVPVREAYNQWTQFESFPQFMESVESVHQKDETHLHWVATIGGQRKEWDAEITEQNPDQRVAWTSTSGDRNAGAVDFHRISDDKTRVTLTMDVEPSGALEKVGDAIGIPSGQVKGDLERFKSFIEDRGRATGAWRGEVEQGDVSGSRSSSNAGATDRELAGAGSMGTAGSTGDLGSDDPTYRSGSSYGGGGTGMTGTTSTGGTADDPYGIGSEPPTRSTGTTTGETGRGEMGSGYNNPQDLGTGRRENLD